MKSRKHWGDPVAAKAVERAEIRDTDDIGSNTSDNIHLDELVRIRLSRRQVLGGGLAAAAVGFFGRSILGSAAATAGLDGEGRTRSALTAVPLGFVAVPVSTDDTVHVPEGYTWDVLIPWGTPLFAGGPEWRKDASNTAADQAAQVGFNHDGMHFFPLEDIYVKEPFGLLVLNHEYTDANQIYTAAQGLAITADDAGREKVAKAPPATASPSSRSAREPTASGSRCRARATTAASPGPRR